MAVLGQIRKRPILTIMIIAGALLLFLVPFNEYNNSNQVDHNNFGEIDGDIITSDEFESMQLFVQQQSQGRATQDQIQNQAWEAIIQNKIAKNHFEQAGFEMNDDILFALEPELKTQYEEIVKRANQGDPQAERIVQDWPKIKLSSEFQIINQQYNSLLSSGLLANKLEVKAFQNNRNTNADIEFVRIDYNTYQLKNKVKVSEQEIQDYINSHPTQFKREEGRTLQYAVFKNTPSAKDKQQILNNVNAFLNGGVERDENNEIIDSVQAFSKATNDSLYVNTYSLEPYNPYPFGLNEIKQYFTPEVSNWAKSASVGQVYGPYELRNSYYLTKLTSKKIIDSIQAKHILISHKDVNPQSIRSKTEAKSLADQILAQIQKDPANFNNLLAQSDDTGSASNGGVAGWTTNENPRFVTEFQNYVQNNPINTYGIVETQYGYHIVTATEKKQGTAYKLANVVKEIRASESSENKIFKSSNKFLQDIKGKSAQDFVNIATKQKIDRQEAKAITRFSPNGIPNLSGEIVNEILRWSFDEKNEIGASNIFKNTNGDYVVAYISGKSEKGLAKAKDVREQIEPLVINKKIAKELATKINTGKTSLEQIAAKYGTKKEAATVNLSQATIPSIGREPKVVGTAFGLKQNAQSKAIEGVAGVYVVKLLRKTKTPTQANEQADLNAVQSQNKSQLSIIRTSLRQEAEIIDNRGKIFN